MRAQINSVREEIGREVEFHVPGTTQCNLCVASGYYDAATDSTTYFTCPVCSGQFYLPTSSQTLIIARVHWTMDEAVTATPGGKYYLGDAQLTIEDKYLSIAQASQSERGKVVVDGHDMNITRITPVGAFANRYRLICSNFGNRPS
jgi:hypothetical protein